MNKLWKRFGLIFFGLIIGIIFLKYLPFFWDLIRNIDKYLQIWSHEHREYIYLILFLIIFCETGLVFMPFLPGDSLLFLAGSIAAFGSISIIFLIIILFIAAVSGDTLNFYLGKRFGKQILAKNYLKQEHWQLAHNFYLKNGKKTIILARFMPIIRTFAPFIAGFSYMPYKLFTVYNFFGGALWITSLCSLGYFFGSFAWVQKNLSALIIGIIFLSLLPAIITIIKNIKFKESK